MPKQHVLAEEVTAGPVREELKTTDRVDGWVAGTPSVTSLQLWQQ